VHSPVLSILSQMEAGGWLGVDLFFVLSGFLITGILDKSLNQPHYFRNFYIRRSLRIFPLFYGVFAFLLLLTPLLHLQWHWGHLWSLVYAQNIAFNVDPSLQTVVPYVAIGHFWSLAVEEQFYMLWPLTLWLVRDRRQMIRLCLGGVIAANLMRLGLWHWLPASEASDWIYKELPTHMDGLLLGACAVLAIRKRSVEDILRRTRLLFYAALAVLLAVCVSARDLDYRSYQMSTIGYTAVAVVFAGLLLRALIPGSLLSRFFSGRILRFFGRYSYGMYVYHYLFNPALVTMRTWLQAQLHIRILGGILAAAITFALSTCAAVASYHLFESRFLKLKDRLAPSSGALKGIRIDAAEVESDPDRNAISVSSAG
jgi:peptidoglycan/LPS O-acetylase OafA/YrhL